MTSKLVTKISDSNPGAIVFGFDMCELLWQSGPSVHFSLGSKCKKSYLVLRDNSTQFFLSCIG